MSLDEDRIVALIGAIADQRDREAFADLFRHFAPRIKAFGLRRGADAGAAEELAQETMVAVWRRAGTFDRNRNSGSAWIYAIARNKRIDLLRREKRPEIDPDDPALAPAPERGPEASYAAGQSQRQLRRAIVDLPDEQAQILRMAYFEDKSHSAIADELAVPLGTIKSRIRLGLGRLKVMMAELEP